MDATTMDATMESIEEDRIIIPPPVVREIIDKTAGFVVKNGRAFEDRISGSAQGNTLKFAFLTELHPYHAYYEQTILDLKEKSDSNTTDSSNTNNSSDGDLNSNANNSSSSSSSSSSSTSSTTDALATNTSKTKSIIASYEVVPFAVRTTQPVLTEPPLSIDNFVLNRPEWVDGRVDDIIKLVARFVAAGGENFIAELAPRESRNPDFMFLQTGHGLHSYYQRVLNSYRAVLQPPPEITTRLNVLAKDETGHESLKECLYRLRWSEKKQKERETSQDVAAQQNAMANIDWHDFVIAATIDFEEEEEEEMDQDNSKQNEKKEIRKSKKKKTITSGSNATVVSQKKTKDDNENDDMFEDSDGDGMDMSDDDEEDEKTTKDIQVVQDYIPNVSGRTTEATQVLDPSTGRALNADEVGEHMRIELLDPAWKEQRDRFVAKQKKTNQISEEQISNNLKKFAENRPDIFEKDQNTTTSSTSSAAAAAAAAAATISKKKTSVVWDGRTGSIAQVQEAASQAQEEMQAHEQLLRERGQHPDQAPYVPGIGPSVSLPPSGPPPLNASGLGNVPALPNRNPNLNAFGEFDIVAHRQKTICIDFRNGHCTRGDACHFRHNVVPIANGGYGGTDSGSGAPTDDRFAKRPRLSNNPLAPPRTNGGVSNPLAPPSASSSSSASASIPTSEFQVQATLIPSSEWLDLCNGHLDLQVTVQVPNDSTYASKWATIGQTLSITTSVTSTVLSLKETIIQKLGGEIPLNKFQLKQTTRGFIKDKQTFAELNFRMDVKLEMQLKTRKRRR